MALRRNEATSRDLDLVSEYSVLAFLGISLGLGELDRWGSSRRLLEINGRQRKYIPEGMALGILLDGNLGVGIRPTPGRETSLAPRWPSTLVGT